MAGTGEVFVTLPTRSPERAASDLVALKRDWLERQLQRLESEGARLAARPALGHGRLLLLDGRPHRVVVELLPSGRRRSRVEHVKDGDAQPILRVLLAPADERPLPHVIERWLRRQARVELERRVRHFAPLLGVAPARLAVRDQRSLWGSASRRGTVSFSWRLLLAPPSVLDYVVVHELVHLADFTHSPRFWRLVRRFAPHVDEARGWLRAHRSDLRRALD